MIINIGFINMPNQLCCTPVCKAPPVSKAPPVCNAPSALLALHAKHLRYTSSLALHNSFALKLNNHYSSFGKKLLHAKHAKRLRCLRYAKPVLLYAKRPRYYITISQIPYRE